jgi:hypothetical protein
MKTAMVLLVVLALVLTLTAPALATKGGSAAPPQVMQRDMLLESIPLQGETAPAPVRIHMDVPPPPIAPGTYTIGAGGDYATLSAAVASLNLNGVAGGGDVIFLFIDPAYTDTGVTIGRYLNQSGTNPVIFRPASGVTPTIRFTGGTSASNAFCVRLDSAAGVVWDGSNAAGSDRSLTIEADTVGTVNRNGFLLQRGTSWITLKNMVVKSNRRAAGNGADPIRITNVVTPVAGAPNHDVTVDNCWVLRGASGLTAIGANTGMLDFNITFTNNLIGGAGGPLLDNLIGSAGAISLQRVQDVTIDRNEIYGSKRAGGSSYGLLILGAGNRVTFTRNRVHDIWVLSGGGAVRMIGVQGQEAVAPAVRTRLTVANNFFYDSHNIGAGSGGRSIENIVYFATGGTPGSDGSAIELVNNTFWYQTTLAEATSGTIFFFDGNAFGGNPAGSPDSLLIQNNISASDRDTLFTRTFLIFEPSVAANFTWLSNNNVYHQTDIGAFGQYPTPWPLGASSVNPTFADWQTISGNDLNSAVGNPEFVSATDPHISTALGVVSPADSLATPFPGILQDIDGDPRDPAAPDAGADEFTVTRFTLDLAAVSVDYPTPTLIIAAGAPFTPTATFRNPGSVSHAAAPVKMDITDLADSVVYTGTATIAIGGYGNTAQATFTPAATLPAGSYTMTATALLPGDLNAGNDAVSSALFVQASVSTLPYSEGFEGGPAGWITTTPGAVNDWVIGTPAKIQISGARTGTMAWVTKVAGNYNDNQESYVNAPILNLTTFSGTLLVQFASNFKTESTFDGGDLEMSLDGGVTWRKVDSTLGTGGNFDTPGSSAWYNESVPDGNISAPYWGGGEGGGVSSAGYSTASAGWVTSATALSGLSGMADVRFRWHFSADGGTNSEGWAIDDVVIRALDSNDVALASVGIPGYVGGPVPDLAGISEPNTNGRNGRARTGTKSGVSLGAFLTAAPITFNAVVRNAGLNAQTAFTVGWEIDATPETPVANSGPLAFGGVQTLPLTWAVPTIGIHALRAYTQLASDSNPANDSASFDFEVLAPNVVFYEGFNGAAFPPAGWDTVNNDGNTGSLRNWYRSAGYPYEGAYGARGNYNTANASKLIDDWLITPNTGNALSPTIVSDSLTFYLTGQGPTYPDSLMILVSTSTANPDSFSLVLDYVLAPPDDYHRFTYPLPNAPNRYIAFRYLIYDGGPAGTSSDNIYLDNVRITRYDSTGTGVGDPTGPVAGLIPKVFALSQNYPNPFNPMTTIKYDLPKDARVTLTIYDLLGRRVATLVDEEQRAGYRSVAWNGANVASGVYLYRIQAGEFTQTRRMLLLK